MESARTGSGSEDGILSELCGGASTGDGQVRKAGRAGLRGVAPWCMLQLLLCHS